MDQDETAGRGGQTTALGPSPTRPLPRAAGAGARLPASRGRRGDENTAPATDGCERHAAHSPGHGGREAAPRPQARPCSVLRGRAERLWPDGRRASDACCPALYGVAGGSRGLLWGPVFTKSPMGKMLPPAWCRRALRGPTPLAVASGSLEMFRGSPPLPPKPETPCVWPSVVQPPLTLPLVS